MFGKGSAPDVAKLAAKRDVAGLIAAVGYDKQRYDQYCKQPEKSNQKFAEYGTGVPQVVGGAALCLAQLGEARAIGPILEAIRRAHYFDPVSGWPAILAKFGSAAVDPLMGAVRGGGRTADMALITLSLIGDQRVVPMLVSERIAIDDQRVVVLTVGKLGGGPEAAEYLVKKLCESHYSKTAVDAFGYGKFGLETADLILDAPGDINCYRICALCEVGSPRGLEMLLGLWEDPRRQDAPLGQVRRLDSSLLSLVRFGDLRIDMLCKSLLSKYEPGSLREVGRVAGGGYQSSQARLTNDQWDAYYAALTLAYRHDTAGVGVLVDTFANPCFDRVNHEDIPLKATLGLGGSELPAVAKRALVAIGEPCLEALKPYLLDQGFNVAYRTKEVITGIAGPEIASLMEATAQIEAAAAWANEIAAANGWQLPPSDEVERLLAGIPQTPETPTPPPLPAGSTGPE